GRTEDGRGRGGGCPARARRGRFLTRLLIARRSGGGGGGRRARLGVFRRLRRALAPRPAREEVFRLAHFRSFCSGPRRASASGSARARLPLWDGRSTWGVAANGAVLPPP